MFELNLINTVFDFQLLNLHPANQNAARTLTANMEKEELPCVFVIKELLEIPTKYVALKTVPPVAVPVAVATLSVERWEVPWNASVNKAT